VLAAAERFDLDGKSVLLGIAVGVETTCRLSLGAPRLIHKAGLHSSMSVGEMSCAARHLPAMREHRLRA